MFKIFCTCCGNGLMVPGGVILSPPNEEGLVAKYHVCEDCYKEIEESAILYDNQGMPFPITRKEIN